MTLPNQIKKDKSAKPMRCLIIQLSALGDLLQSLMALRAAKQLYPQLEIHFIGRAELIDPVQKVNWIERAIPFSSRDILESSTAQTEAIRRLAFWLNGVAGSTDNHWDFVVNWTFSEASSYLTSLIPGRVKLGYTRRRDNSFSAADGWSSYVQAVLQNGITQNIHVTDILTTQLLTALQIHIGEPTGDSNAAVTSKCFFALRTTSEQLRNQIESKLDSADSAKSFFSKKWIGVQIGTGSTNRTWPADHWAELIRMVMDRNPEYGICLLGGQSDLASAEIILRSLGRSAPLVSFVGETDFDQWASLVCRCQWLFSGVTAATSLASVLGIRILNIELGPARHHESGPYGNGHYVICRENAAITPDAAYAVWSYASNEWSHRRQMSIEHHIKSSHLTSEFNAVKVLRSRIRGSADGGGVFFEPVVGKQMNKEDWTSMVIGHIARAWYCGWMPPVGQDLTREMIHPGLIQGLRELDESTQVLTRILSQAAQTAQQIYSKSQSLRSERIMGLKDRNELNALGASLRELEALLERTAQTNPALLLFSKMLKILLHQLKGSQLSELSKETIDSYKQLSEGASLFREWIAATLSVARPVAVKSATVRSIEKGAPL